MKDGLIRLGAVSSPLKVADVKYNSGELAKRIFSADDDGEKLIVFPELALTGVSAGDLFRQQSLQKQAESALFELIERTRNRDILVVLGLPLAVRGRLYSAAALFTKGELLGLVPKTLLPASGALMQGRVFSAGPRKPERIVLRTPSGSELAVPFGRDLLFTAAEDDARIGVIFTEELTGPLSDGVRTALAGANLLVCPGNAPERAGGRAARRELLENFSRVHSCGLLYAGPSQDESTEDSVWSAHSLIAENGVTLAEALPFGREPAVAEIDTELLRAEAPRGTGDSAESFAESGFFWKTPGFSPSRIYPPYPFRPDDREKRRAYFEEVLSLQAMGLRKRLEHTGLSRVLIGISGGLDSAWALIVAARAFDYLGLDRSRITAVTMPCFGTSGRTYRNALALSDSIGAELLEINIKNAVRAHFEDIGQDEGKKDVAYENSQARERTQVLMDLANRLNGLVVGTGDLSELALGWATYNGDHMSNYGVNGSVPKTLMRELVRNYGEETDDPELRRVLFDILDTPVSPELLPAEEGKIAQKTEDLVGPYELHDFFLYYLVKYGFRPSKLFRMAVRSWGSEYDSAEILKWLKTFCRRFVTQEFKRSCMPDGPCATEISLSPRGAMMMPSDASAELLLRDLEDIVL